jgi:subtilisin family serine protease
MATNCPGAVGSFGREGDNVHRHVGIRRRRLMVAALALALTASLAAAGAAAASSSPGLRKIDPQVLQSVRGGKTATYWVILRQRADLSGAASIKSWIARGWYVYNKLAGVARSSQRGVRALLARWGARYQSFWIINAFRITSEAGTLASVAARPEVARVVPDWSARIPRVRMTADVAAIEWNIQRVRAPEVWSQYDDRGQNVTVANIDTGVQFDHPALKRQYRGISTVGTTVKHDYNWWDPSHTCPQPAPCDNVGHGTHTMGTIVGDDHANNQIGVAPQAHWIAAKGCEDVTCSSFALMSSGQWMLAPTKQNGQDPRPDLRPQAVNNSWSSANGSDTFYQAIVQSWVAAGIFPVFSVGGNGPGCGTVGAPASYPESYGVSAFDMNDNIASFASRGPSPLGGAIKPNVTAPGVSIRSSVPGNGYLIFSGTSMATPHVVGAVALIWTGAPAFRGNIAGTRSIIDQTAIDSSDLQCGGTPGNNNVYGEGRLDAFAAVTKAKGLSGEAHRPE